MRVKFIRDYPGGKGEESYTKGQVIDLDQGLAAQLIEANYAEDFPRTDAEVAEQAAKYYAGDDKRTPAQIKDRVPQVVMLQGDTRAAVEEQRGESDPHEARKEDEQAAEAGAEVKLEKMREAREEAPPTDTRETTAARRRADEQAAEEARQKAEKARAESDKPKAPSK